MTIIHLNPLQHGHCFHHTAYIMAVAKVENKTYFELKKSTYVSPCEWTLGCQINSVFIVLHSVVPLVAQTLIITVQKTDAQCQFRQDNTNIIPLYDQLFCLDNAETQLELVSTATARVIFFITTNRNGRHHNYFRRGTPFITVGKRQLETLPPATLKEAHMFFYNW